VKKENLPSKLCPVCKRPFVWRKKMEIKLGESEVLFKKMFQNKLKLTNIIVLQHIKIEDPGYIKDLMLEDGFKLTTIELDEGEKIPKKILMNLMECFAWEDQWILIWKKIIHG